MDVGHLAMRTGFVDLNPQHLAVFLVMYCSAQTGFAYEDWQIRKKGEKIVVEESKDDSEEDKKMKWKFMERNEKVVNLVFVSVEFLVAIVVNV